jgi:hypothetical protein
MKYQLAIFESPKKNEFFFHNQASIYYDFIQLSFRQFSTIGIKDSILPPFAAYQLLFYLINMTRVYFRQLIVLIQIGKIENSSCFHS